MKQETHDNKTLDVVLGDFDLHGLILSEFKQSVKENPADLTLNNLSVLSPPHDLTALLDDPFNDRVELVILRSYLVFRVCQREKERRKKNIL